MNAREGREWAPFMDFTAWSVVGHSLLMRSPVRLSSVIGSPPFCPFPVFSPRPGIHPSLWVIASPKVFPDLSGSGSGWRHSPSPSLESPVPRLYLFVSTCTLMPDIGNNRYSPQMMDHDHETNFRFSVLRHDASSARTRFGGVGRAAADPWGIGDSSPWLSACSDQVLCDRME